MQFSRTASAFMLFAALGTVGAPRVAVASAQSSQLVPGSYARYLIHNGLPREMALAQALRAGEAPTPVASCASPAPLELTSYEAYQRTVLARSLEEILRDRARGTDFAAHPRMSGGEMSETTAEGAVQVRLR